MSKNFELMQQVKMERGIGPTPELDRALSVGDVNGNGHQDGTGLDFDQMARVESLKLVQRVFLLQAADRPRAVVFAGVDRGDGCSRICAGTAATLARNVSGSVCLMDANLRSPSLARFFDVPDHHGLADALLQKGSFRAFTRKLHLDNLWLLPCGSFATDSPSLLSSDSLKAPLAELSKEFAYVLINAPPVILDGTAALLGALVDGIILVVEANSTRREVARKAKETLEFASVRLLGAVLNNRTFPIPSSIYSRL